MAKIENLTVRRMAGDIGRSRGQGRRCPICGTPTAERYRPFCSRRCADIDLGRWLKEGYRVPTEDAPGSGPDTTGEEQ